MHQGLNLGPACNYADPYQCIPLAHPYPCIPLADPYQCILLILINFADPYQCIPLALGITVSLINAFLLRWL